MKEKKKNKRLIAKFLGYTWEEQNGKTYWFYKNCPHAMDFKLFNFYNWKTINEIILEIKEQGFNFYNIKDESDCYIACFYNTTLDFTISSKKSYKKATYKAILVYLKYKKK